MSSSTKSVSELRYLIETARYGNASVVKNTVTTVYTWLRANKDGHSYRDFFRECYYPLVAAVFGLASSSNSMLGNVRPNECDTLLNFVRPSGTFFQAMLEVDAENMNHYRLPTTHLSAHTQALLCTAVGALPNKNASRALIQIQYQMFGATAGSCRSRTRRAVFLHRVQACKTFRAGLTTPPRSSRCAKKCNTGQQRQQEVSRTALRCRRHSFRCHSAAPSWCCSRS